MAEPVARGPIAPAPPEEVVDGWIVSGRRSMSELTLTDLSPVAKVAVRADPGGPTAEALAGPAGTGLVTSAVAGEWLVLAEPGERVAVEEWLASLPGVDQGHVSVIDLTHGRALVRLTGARAADVLAKECAVDLGDRGCPDGRTLRTTVAGLAVEVVRQDSAGVPSYLLHCERSSGQYLFDALLDAGADLGADVDGYRPPGLGKARGASS